MKLSANGLRIELLPRRAADDEDWVRVQVVVAARGFTGNFEASLQLSDLLRFERELAVMYDSVEKRATAALSSAEPDIQIELAMQPLGSIVGKYSLECEPTVLSGTFELDQSFLPELRQSINALAEQLRGENVP